MNAIILAGGRGSRLGELTESRPKPLIEVAGKPILEHLLQNASEAGITNFRITLGYRGDMIQNYCGDGSKFGIHIKYLKPSGKGPEDAIFGCMDYLPRETFCCFCGDNIVPSTSIALLLRQHQEQMADATFTLEQGESTTIKRVKIQNRRIIGSSTSPLDKVLVYNMAMEYPFLNLLYETIKSKEERAFAFAMDELAHRFRIHAIDVPFMNINRPEDTYLAERFLHIQEAGKREH